MKIGVVIVTYNRKKDLEQALNLFDGQTHLPEYIIVVNNASTDDTRELLDQWSQKESLYKRIAVHMKSNQGGSGGFYEGLRLALEQNAEWIWVSDDDAFPEGDALEQAEKYLNAQQNHWDEISAICGTVFNHGKIDTQHRKRYYTKGIQIVIECISESEYEKETFSLNAFSYVGSIINKKKLIQAGLPVKDYFIWLDDTEHSLRLSKIGKILCIPAIKIHHDVQDPALAMNWKMYYGFRNMCDMYRKHMPWICYKYFCVKIIIKVFLSKLSGQKRDEMNILYDSYRDAKYGCFGIHPIYRPGWSGNNKSED